MILLRFCGFDTEIRITEETDGYDEFLEELTQRAQQLLMISVLDAKDAATLSVIEQRALVEAARRNEAERAALYVQALTDPLRVLSVVDGGEAHDEALLEAKVEEIARRRQG